MAFGFGFLGYALRKLDVPLPPVVLAVQGLEVILEAAVHGSRRSQAVGGRVVELEVVEGGAVDAPLQREAAALKREADALKINILSGALSIRDSATGEKITTTRR